MNKETFQGQWDEIKSQLQKQWSKLTDTDLSKIKEDVNQIFGILEQYYGETKEKIKETLDSLFKKK